MGARAAAKSEGVRIADEQPAAESREQRAESALVVEMGTAAHTAAPHDPNSPCVIQICCFNNPTHPGRKKSEEAGPKRQPSPTDAQDFERRRPRAATGGEGRAEASGGRVPALTRAAAGTIKAAGERHWTVGIQRRGGRGTVHSDV